MIDTRLVFSGMGFSSLKPVLRLSQMPTDLGLKTLIEETACEIMGPIWERARAASLLKLFLRHRKIEDSKQDEVSPHTQHSAGALSLELDAEERQELVRLANKQAAEARLVQRSKIILLAANEASVKEVVEAVGVSPKTARKWPRVYYARREENPESTVAERLADAKRPGRPDSFDEFFWVDVLVVATADPENYGLPITHWTVRELAETIIELNHADSIHYTTVARFLARCRLQPHRVEQWMNRKQDPEFEQRAEDVKDCLVTATTEPPPGEVTVSFDEKTGVQAKERIAPLQPARLGRPARIEFEYKRHGTLVLFGMMLIHSGEISGFTGPTRTNVDTAEVLGGFFETLLNAGYSRIHVVLDQLNTHWSVDLIHSICTLCNLPIPPAKEIGTGPQRKAWLSAPDKPIVFHFTPKHASWLNPIEIWFGVLVGKVLRRGSFPSTEDLDHRIQRFIRYYNERLAHPYSFRHHQKAA